MLNSYSFSTWKHSAVAHSHWIWSGFCLVSHRSFSLDWAIHSSRIYSLGKHLEFDWKQAHDLVRLKSLYMEHQYTSLCLCYNGTFGNYRSWSHLLRSSRHHSSSYTLADKWILERIQCRNHSNRFDLRDMVWCDNPPHMCPRHRAWNLFPRRVDCRKFQHHKQIYMVCTRNSGDHIALLEKVEFSENIGNFGDISKN